VLPTDTSVGRRVSPHEASAVTPCRPERIRSIEGSTRGRSESLVRSVWSASYEICASKSTRLLVPVCCTRDQALKTRTFPIIGSFVPENS